MITLALDTTTPVGGLALLHGGTVTARLDGDPSRTHGVRLPGDIARMLGAEGIQLADVTLYAVARGPGGFTGLRVGMATIQGLALVHGRPVVPVSALDASARVAHAAGMSLQGDDLLGVWMDAHRGEVFSSLFGLDSAGGGDPRLVTIEPALVDTPAATLERWRPRVGSRRMWLTGGGVCRYRAEAARSGVVDEIPSEGNLASMVGVMAVESAQRGATLTAHELMPLYVRRPDAELARQRQDGR